MVPRLERDPLQTHTSAAFSLLSEKQENVKRLICRSFFHLTYLQVIFSLDEWRLIWKSVAETQSQSRESVYVITENLY